MAKLWQLDIEHGLLCGRASERHVDDFDRKRIACRNDDSANGGNRPQFVDWRNECHANHSACDQLRLADKLRSQQCGINRMDNGHNRLAAIQRA